MFVALVTAHVKPNYIDEFIKATLDNTSNSINEPGISRFDFYQQSDDPTKFTLVEIYQSEEDTIKHRSTEHYTRWKNTVEEMMAEPRSRTVNKILFPQISEG